MSMLKDLNRITAALPQQKPVKVLQFGKGNFLRAFADWMIDIMNEHVEFNGAIQIVQVNSKDDDNRFQNQDGLYHVVVNGIQDGKTVNSMRLISAIDGLINPFNDYTAFISTAENAEIKIIISNTTEAGITFDASDGDMNTLSRTFPGKLSAWLYHRFNFFKGDPSKAPILLPCELVERNGELLRDAILQYARHWKLPVEFEKWVVEHCGFCNTLVDRIVPGFPKDNAEDIWQRTGYRDELIVSAEPYHLWVIQPLTTATFTTEKLRNDFPLEKAGFRVMITTDLTPYRTSKVRILNGAHTTMVPVAWLRGIRTVKDAINDKFVSAFIKEAIAEEIIPTLDLPRQDLEQFAVDVIERFQNPFVRHELSAIALNSIAKFQVRVLPSILEFHRRTGKLPDRLLRALAALIVFYKGNWKGEATPVKDTAEVMTFFEDSWKDPSTVVEHVLSNEQLWNTNLARINGMKDTVQKEVSALLALEKGA